MIDLDKGIRGVSNNKLKDGDASPCEFLMCAICNVRSKCLRRFVREFLKIGQLWYKKV